MSDKKIGILLVNLGSPSSVKTSAVRAFLKQFLWDKRVVNLPRPLWWLILHWVILPFRPRKSAEAYRKIWRSDGSPLTVFTRSLAEKLADQFVGSSMIINYAMSYGQPSIAAQLTAFQQQSVNEIRILPLYPQYSSTTTASVYDEVCRVLMRWRAIPNLRFISDYHQHPLYIKSLAQSIQQFWQQHGRGQQLLLSFHGLPAKLTEWGDPYFDQCQRTGQLLAAELQLDDQQWQLVFQSRFGRAEWLKPYCVDTLKQLPNQGIKHLDVVCPGFAVDCLETLEEIALTNQAIFLTAGGLSYRYIAALNDTPEQLALMTALVTTTD
jgi:ferrochelatase